MKIIVCVVILVAVVAAEPPSYRQVKFRSEKSGAESAPYPSSGFKPTKEFNLPVRQELAPPAASYGTPEDSYGAPFNTFLAPQVEYGPPKARISERRKDVNKEEHSESESLESPESSESAESASKENGSGESREKQGSGEKTERSDKYENKENSENRTKKPKENLAINGDEIISTKGAYFVLLPSSQLQRVQYSTQNDLTKMAYTANLQYMNENAPVYIYTPTPQYQRIQQPQYQQIQQPVVAAYSYTW